MSLDKSVEESIRELQRTDDEMKMLLVGGLDRDSRNNSVLGIIESIMLRLDKLEDLSPESNKQRITDLAVKFGQVGGAIIVFLAFLLSSIGGVL